MSVFRDFSYGSSASAPTGEKPQSKLWFNDGSWWESSGASPQDLRHLPVNWSTDAWTDTGVGVDPERSRADALWDGSNPSS
jgi:hypothetical protein